MTTRHARSFRPRARGSLLLIGAFLAAGCSSPTTPASRALRIIPADGATGVRLDASVVLDFGISVERATVERGLHLLSESDMTGSCPDSSTMDMHANMQTIMNDPAMLQHMDRFHSTHGRYSWSSSGTTCTFTPDSLMQAQTGYMIHMSGSMTDMMGRMGGSMMPGRMNGSGDMMTHFETMASRSAAPR